MHDSIRSIASYVPQVWARRESDDALGSASSTAPGNVSYENNYGHLIDEDELRGAAADPRGPMMAPECRQRSSSSVSSRGRRGGGSPGAGEARLLLFDLIQTLVYLVFMVTLFLYVDKLRSTNEFYLFKHIEDTFIENHFDSSHNDFLSVRRVADIWEWGNNVLIPGLMGNAGPCAAVVGAEGHFRSALGAYAGPTDLAGALAAKGCNDDTWPDGRGSFHLDGSSGLTVAELLARHDQIDWSAGVLLRQLRAEAHAPERMYSRDTLGETMPAESRVAALCARVDGERCFLALEGGVSTAVHRGFNWSEPSAPIDHPWRYHDGEQLGNNVPLRSSHIASRRTMPPGGYVAAFIPFISDELLPEQRGTSDEVIDFRAHTSGGFYADLGLCVPDAAIDPSTPVPARGRHDCVPRFECVRLSWNGELLHQLCDPMGAGDGASGADSEWDPDARTTGVARAAVEEFWNDLKRAHWLDPQTRALMITLQLDGNSLGLSSYTTLFFELTATSAILPSYAAQVNHVDVDAALLYGAVALGVFCLAQAFEVGELRVHGWRKYLGNVYNYVDLVALYQFVQMAFVLRRLQSADHSFGGSEVSQSMGYFDNYDFMEQVSDLRRSVAVVLCLQLLKGTQYLVLLVPRLGLVTGVLSWAFWDLVSFSLVFAVTLVAFSQLFCMQMGAVDAEYHSSISSLLRPMSFRASSPRPQDFKIPGGATPSTGPAFHQGPGGLGGL